MHDSQSLPRWYMEIIDSEQNRTDPVEVGDGGQDPGPSERDLPVSWLFFLFIPPAAGTIPYRGDSEQDLCHPRSREFWGRSGMPGRNTQLSDNVINHLHW